jgi:AraC-like DNA-binding protein
VGYEDSSSFNRLFKRITGMTPGGYRKRFSLTVMAG